MSVDEKATIDPEKVFVFNQSLADAFPVDHVQFKYIGHVAHLSDRIDSDFHPGFGSTPSATTLEVFKKCVAEMGGNYVFGTQSMPDVSGNSMSTRRVFRSGDVYFRELK